MKKIEGRSLVDVRRLRNRKQKGKKGEIGLVSRIIYVQKVREKEHF